MKTLAKRQTRQQKNEAFEKATKLWEIWEIALHDLAECEKIKKCTIDMSEWFVKKSTGCGVCAAGAVIRQRLDYASTSYATITGVYRPVSFEWSLGCKLRAINHLRSGDVSEALDRLESIPFDPFGKIGFIPRHALDRSLVEYQTKECNAIENQGWWEEANQLLVDLKREDI